MQHVEQMFETNVFGPVRLIQAFVPAMRSRRSGVVVNISSVAGHVAQPLSGFYAATKHAFEAISEALYVELAHFGVRVVVIEPGFIAPGHEGPGAGRRARTPTTSSTHSWPTSPARCRAGARPGPELVATAVADAIDNEDGAFAQARRRRRQPDLVCAQQPRGRRVREGPARRRRALLVARLWGGSRPGTCCLGSGP